MGSNIDDLKLPNNKSTYVADLNTSLDAMDTHEHGPGKGSPVKRIDSAALTSPNLTESSGVVSVAQVDGVHLNANVADGSTIEVASNTLQLKDGGLTQAKFKLKTVGSGGADPGVGNVSKSTKITYSSPDANKNLVTNSSITLTTSGNPILLMLVADTDTGNSYIDTGTTGVGSVQRIYINHGVDGDIWESWGETSKSVGSINPMEVPPSAVFHIDNRAAGTHTWSLYVHGNINLGITNAYFMAVELL